MVDKRGHSHLCHSTAAYRTLPCIRCNKGRRCNSTVRTPYSIPHVRRLFHCHCHGKVEPAQAHCPVCCTHHRHWSQTYHCRLHGRHRLFICLDIKYIHCHGHDAYRDSSDCQHICKKIRSGFQCGTDAFHCLCSIHRRDGNTGGYAAKPDIRRHLPVHVRGAGKLL